MTREIAGIVICLTAGVCFAADTNKPAVVPAPQQMALGEGVFTLTPNTRICVDRASVATGQQLAVRWRKSTGYSLEVVSRFSAGYAIKNAILLTTKNARADLGSEGYELNVATNSIVLRAPAQAGLFYGAQTLSQLLPPQVFSTNLVRGEDWRIPCVQIVDQPRFKWRGMMLDVSRDFFSKEEIEQLLNLLALHKINTFHWHLVDNNGWRIEIKRYPKLTEIGAWRQHSRVLPGRQKATNLEQDAAHPAWAAALPSAYGPDGRYGGFYTPDEVREVVAHARARHITVVPEIEMPGHSAAALSAYPELNCTGVLHGAVYCAGRDASFEFLEGVLKEVFELFPGPYIHIGGDEVRMDNWAHCDQCQARMKAEGLTNVTQLQSYFIRRIEKFVAAHGRKLVGWSEIGKGGLAKNATVMDWIGTAVETASAGHDVVMSPREYCYLDQYQSLDHSTEPWAIGGYLPLSELYAFEPVPVNLEPQFQSHILGAQGNLWTEYVASFKHVEYMAFPRMCALAEVVWSPKEERNWDDFSRRLQIHLRRLDELSVNYRPVSVNLTRTPPEPHDTGLR
jgi:hexosaminidase